MSISILKVLRSPVLKNRQTKLFNFLNPGIYQIYLPVTIWGEPLLTPVGTCWGTIK